MMTNSDEVKDKVYDDMDSVISATSRTDKLTLLGDFNTRVGADLQTWEGVIGSEGIGKCNRNGILLLRKYTERDLLITNTIFCLPNRNKVSRCHQTQPKNLACTVTTRQESSKEIGCLHAETRIQETSFFTIISAVLWV